MKKSEPSPTHSPSPEQKTHEAWENIFPYLKKLTATESPSGQEGPVRDLLIHEAERLDIESRTDEIGNLWLPSDAPEGEILLCSHMDKLGDAKKAVVQGTTVCGRLDDALGTSIIMAALKKGHRPSVLFTVEEENGRHGSWCAVQSIKSGETTRPKLVLILDMSTLQQRGVGPLCYTSSGGGPPFPEVPIKAVKAILERVGIRASFIPGIINDSYNFSRLPKQGTLTIQVHVDNMHSQKETADIADVEEAAAVLEAILRCHAEIPEAT